MTELIEAAVLSPRSPASRQAHIARDVVEDVLLEIKGLSRHVDRSAIVRDIHDALAALHELQESEVDDPRHLELLARATDLVRRAGDTIEGHDLSDRSLRMCRRMSGVALALEHAREATIDVIVSGQQRVIDEALRSRADEQLPEGEAFTVSIGSPHLHSFDRAPLRARVDVRPEDFVFEDLPAGEPSETEEATLTDAERFRSDLDLGEQPGLGGELADEADPVKRLTVLASQPAMIGDATATPGLAGELAFLQRLARNCLEDISANSNLRRLEEDDRYIWSAQRAFEQRMCASLDAFIALGQSFHSSDPGAARHDGIDVLETALHYGRDAITIDPGRAFARTFALVSVAGNDTVRAAMLALKQSHPHTHDVQGEALALAPNPAVDEALTRLLGEADSRLVVLALDTLYGRGRSDVATLVPLLEHPEEVVRARAVRALGLAGDRLAAANLLLDLIDTEIEDEVVAAAAEALVFLGSEDGVEVVRERLEEAVEEPGLLRQDVFARFMQLLGVAGKARDHALLCRAYTGEPGEAAALGFHGHPGCVETLLDPLKGRAAQVITGQRGMREAALALLRITGAPIHAPARTPHFDFYDVVVDEPTMRFWWDDNGERFDPDLRYRFGDPWTGLHSVVELERDAVHMWIRRLCALELGMLLGRRPLLGHDFASQQAAQIAAQRASVEALIAEGSHLAGAWPTRRR